MQKFDSAGRFVLTFGGEVNKTTSANLCTAASHDVCGTGVAGTAPGQFSASYSYGLAAGLADDLFVADKDRIQRFNLQGEFQASVPVPGKQVQYLAFDPVSKDLYVTYAEKTGVHKLDATTGTEIGELQGQTYVATDPDGNVYTLTEGGVTQKIVQYDSSGNPLSPPTCCQPPLLPTSNFDRYVFNGIGTNGAGDLYVSHTFSQDGSSDSFIRLFGPGPVSFEAPPRVPPEILSQFATSVDRTGAVVSAEVNPHFWADTRFYVQYGTGKCSEGGCPSERPLPPGASLTTKAVAAALKTPGVFLEGLEPGTTYHYRFVAQSSGGGPVRGIGGKVGADGGESSFTTYPASTAKLDCPNQQFRTGFSAQLPDCRAFEMVSPVEKNNGDIKALVTINNFTTALDQSSSDGNRFTYSSYRAFADPQAGTYTSQYIAERQAGAGWASESISPVQGHAAAIVSESNLDNAYKAFSADLCSGWLVSAAEPVLAPGAIEGYGLPYRRDNCGGEGYEAMVTVEPTAAVDFELQGVSADGKKAIVRVRDKLTADAASGVNQTYYSSNGELYLVCILPNGFPSGQNCTGGSASPGATTGAGELGRMASVTNAISADGHRVYWTDSGPTGTVPKGGRSGAPGKIYLRLNPDQEQSALSGGQCTEAEKACTLKVSETVSTKAAEFLAATGDGDRALFEVTEGAQAGNLYRYDLEAGASTLVAKKVGVPSEEGPGSFVTGLLGASEDLSHVYFVSQEVLPETSGATAGKLNLYLDREGAKTFIATLSSGDVPGVNTPSNFSPAPIYKVARVSPDGNRLAFISTGSLTGYDNTDQVSGEADAEVYLYEAGAAGPVCVSCNPSGARPRGRALVVNGTKPRPVAATIPPAQHTLHFPRSLSDDGKRLFFDSYDPLLPRDTNGKADVYQWEAASGANDCEEAGAELYVPASQGCLSLISSGQSPSDSEFLDASPSGDDVFFTTSASLVPQDSGLIDVYDARVNGGFAQPSRVAACEGEACQGPPPPPNDPTPASATFDGAGNVTKAPRTRCAKGKVRRKGRCVAKKHKRATKQHGQRASHNRGANR
ncbi:MAG: hypothetical protein QOF06_1150 [Solirubrobacterales bacterium]|nr:hypothetical protein [Solirubrobacterales bacterium]